MTTEYTAKNVLEIADMLVGQKIVSSLLFARKVYTYCNVAASVHRNKMLSGFCRICVLFDENKTGAHTRKDVKNAPQKLAKSGKISEHGDTKYHPMTCKL